jgi:hypothetical protein
VEERHHGRRPPSAAQVRATLLDHGLVDRPPRDLTNELKRRLTGLERAVQQLDPPVHPKLHDVVAGYAARLRTLADALEALVVDDFQRRRCFCLKGVTAE